MRVQDQEEKKIKSLLHGFILEGSTNALNQEMKLKEELIFWRTKMEGMVQFKDWIYFASNYSKLVPMFLDHVPPPKAPLTIVFGSFLVLLLCHVFISFPPKIVEPKSKPRKC